MSIELPAELEQLVRRKLAEEHYNSEGEVVRRALHLLDEQDRYLNLRKEEIREKIASGHTSLRAGRRVDGEAAFRRIEKGLGTPDPDPR